MLNLGGIFASLVLHDTLLRHCLRSPLTFYDTTPLGRILNRFSKDTDTIDVMIPQNLRGFLICALHSIQVLIAIAIATPKMLLVGLPLGALYFIVQVVNVYFLCACYMRW